MSLFTRPSVLYPTLVKGVIDGPIRCESLDGSELWLEPRSGPIFMPPWTYEGKTYCVSHLQKKANYFSLRFDPFIYHYGNFWHLQEQKMINNVLVWQPGTERGIYGRTWGWRFQIPDANSNGTPWIFSKGYLGGHLD